MQKSPSTLAIVINPFKERSHHDKENPGFQIKKRKKNVTLTLSPIPPMHSSSPLLGMDKQLNHTSSITQRKRREKKERTKKKRDPPSSSKVQPLKFKTRRAKTKKKWKRKDPGTSLRPIFSPSTQDFPFPFVLWPFLPPPCRQPILAAVPRQRGLMDTSREPPDEDLFALD